MQTKIVLFLLLTIAVLLTVIFFGILKFSPTETELISEQKLLLKKIEELGRLELIRMSFNDIVEQRINRKLFGEDALSPDSRVLLVINGEVVSCIDLSVLTTENIKVEPGRIILKLPEPEICYTKVDHKNSKVYDVNLTARLIDPDLVGLAYKNAEKTLEEKAIESGIFQQTKENAKKFLRPFLETLTNKEIVITFKFLILNAEGL